ncbi:MAG TPA: manno-octulosonate cytidylyltransferase [Thermohalobaculum sp.]|nr:manno-octulosonate cytidylyltransferase [Thermohalobaculum sp.]
MSVCIVIPARYGSTRYPGKALAPLRGATGEARPLVRRTWDAARAVAGIARIVIATDDPRIEAEARGFGAEVAMTSPDCANGTERCAEALAALAPEPEIVVNLQGDAPLTPPWFIEALVAAMRARAGLAVATPVLRCDAEALASLLADRRAGRIGATTVVCAADGRALYFSKEVIPFTGRALAPGESCPVFHHVGVYAYRPAALRRYVTLPAGPLEQWEGLEQLRFLENGEPVLCVEVEARGARFWELNNPEDVAPIERVLAERGIA